MENKYISFSPLFSGLCNVIMSYEVAFAISHITGRTIILPPKTWLLFISESQNFEDFSDIWRIFDKDLVKSEFNCIEFEDVPEFQGYYDQIKGDKSFTKNISKYIPDVKEIFFEDKYSGNQNSALYVDNVVLYNDVINESDFQHFLGRRTPLSLNLDNKFIHFEANLFGSFWYHIYPGDAKKRNELKEKINRCFRYKQKYYDLSERVSNKVGTYNALHIRRGDFLYVRPDYMEPVNSDHKILNKISQLIPKHIPVYISTDETDLSFFGAIKDNYQVHFYNEFGYELDLLDRAVLEQVICSRADQFYGTWLSTYTKRINVMRGCDNKLAYDWMAYNHIPNQLEINSSKHPIPWNMIDDKLWQWSFSYHPQWTFENENMGS